MKNTAESIVGATGTFTATWGEVCQCTVKSIVGPNAMAVDYWSGGSLIRDAWIYAAGFVPTVTPTKESITPAS